MTMKHIVFDIIVDDIDWKMYIKHIGKFVYFF
jgi:hypothetical protein